MYSFLIFPLLESAITSLVPVFTGNMDIVSNYKINAGIMYVNH